MVHGKLGRFPLITYVKSRMISYWCNMVYGNNTNKLSSRIYKALLFDYTNRICKYKWFNLYETIFNETGFSYVWLSQNNVNCGHFSKITLEKRKDQYPQIWKDNVYHSSKGFDYRLYKDIFNLEPYLLLLNKHNRSTFIK